MKHAFALIIAVSLLSCKKDLQEDAIAPVNPIEAAREQPDELAALNVKKMFNLHPSTNVDQSKKISDLIQENKKLFFPKRTYIIDDVLQIVNVKNVMMAGEPGTIFKTTRNNKIIQIFGN